MYMPAFSGKILALRKAGSNRARVLSCPLTKINTNSGNVVVVPLSKNIKWTQTPDGKKTLRYDWHYVLYKQKYPLNYDSAVYCEDIRSISKVRLGKYICHVDPQDMKNISKRIKRALQT